MTDAASPVRMRAYLLASRIETKGLARADGPGVDPTIVRLESGGQAFVFRDGAAAFLGATEASERAFIKSLAARLRDGVSPPSVEDATILVRTEGEEQALPDGAISVRGLDAPRMIVVADVLTKAAALNHYEPLVERVLEHVEPLAARLARDGKAGAGLTELSKAMGQALLAEHRLVGRTAVAEKPEALWDHPEFERLYARLEAEYELRDRALILERKLDLLRTTSSFITDLIQNKRSHLLEWGIIGLILFEIVWTLGAAALGQGH